MKKVILWTMLLAVMMAALPCMAVGEQPQPVEVTAPGFVYYTLGTEAAALVRLSSDHTREMGGLFLLEDGYLTIGYERIDASTIGPFAQGEALTCLNGDLSVRWVLDDERLAGACYTDLLELPDALLLGTERSAPERMALGQGQAPSLMLVEKDTGKVRWQVEGNSPNVWIADFMADGDGNILVVSNGGIQDTEGGAGTLTLLRAEDGAALWSVPYGSDYGVTTFRDICPLGDGLLLYGDHTVLYTDRQGAVRGWFTFQDWESRGDYTSLWLLRLSDDVVYLGGWEMERSQDRRAEIPYNGRTLLLMRITEDTFVEEVW